MPLISIIVPVYNSSKYLRACLDSIVNQTFSEFELIIVNDGSTDDSDTIIDEYAKSDERIKVFSQANKGQASARNFGVNQSVSDWICFIDSDDVINPYFLEYLYKAVTENNAGMSVCSYIEGEKTDNAFFEKKEYLYTDYEINESNVLDLVKEFSNIYWLVCTKLIRKDIVVCQLFDEGRIYEDNAVAPKWLYKAKKIVVVDLPLYFYTQNDKSTTHSAFSLKQLDLLWALEQQLAFLDSISFYKMELRILLFYMDCTDSLISKMSNQIEYKKCCKVVRKQSKRIVKKHVQNLILYSEEEKRIRSFLHPFLTRIICKMFRNDR